jgi:uncharacterized protein YuzE
MMRIKVDEKSDALYIRLDESLIVDSEEIKPGIILDYNDKNQAVGIEILGIKKRIPLEDLKKFQFETT